MFPKEVASARTRPGLAVIGDISAQPGCPPHGVPVAVAVRVLVGQFTHVVGVGLGVLVAPHPTRVIGMRLFKYCVALTLHTISVRRCAPSCTPIVALSTAPVILPRIMSKSLE